MRIDMKTLLLASLLLALLTQQTHAQDPCAIIWDPAILLSDTIVDGNSPQIALSGADTIHVTWEGAVERLPYARSIDAGTSFIRSDILTDTIPIPFTVWNRICSEGQRVYAIFGAPGVDAGPMFMKASTDGGTSWKPIETITDTAVEIRSVAVERETLSVLYSRRGIKQILRSTDSGSSWTTTAQGFNYHARVALSPGVLHLVQNAVVSGHIETQYRRSHDLGDTWVQSSILSTMDQFDIADATIAASSTRGDTSVIAAWRDPKYGCLGLVGCSIISRLGIVGPDSTSWLPETTLTEVPLGYAPELNAGRDGFAAAWPMDHAASPHAQVRASRGTSWCPLFDPTSGVTTRGVDRVGIASSSKAIHVVWSASQAAGLSTFRIFYRRGRFIDTDVKGEPVTLPPFARLQQNYPNPFNPTTKIVYRVQSREFVELRVFDVLGREVATLVDERKEPGEYTSEWKAEGMPSGVYYYRLVTGTRVETKKAVLIR